MGCTRERLQAAAVLIAVQPPVCRRPGSSCNEAWRLLRCRATDVSATPCRLSSSRGRGADVSHASTQLRRHRALCARCGRSERCRECGTTRPAERADGAATRVARRPHASQRVRECSAPLRGCCVGGVGSSRSGDGSRTRRTDCSLAHCHVLPDINARDTCPRGCCRCDSGAPKCRTHAVASAAHTALTAATSPCTRASSLVMYAPLYHNNDAMRLLSRTEDALFG